MPISRKVIIPILQLVFLFLLSILLASFLAPIYSAQGMQAFGRGNENNPWNSIFYIAIVLIFTLIILKIAKRKKKNVIKWIFLLGIGMTIMYVVSPLTYAIMFPQEYERWDSIGEGVIYTHDGHLYILNSTGIYLNDTRIMEFNGDVDSVRNFSVSPSCTGVLYDNSTLVIYGKNTSVVRNVTDVDVWNDTIVFLNSSGVWYASGMPLVKGDFNWIHASEYAIVCGNGTSMTIITPDAEWVRNSTAIDALVSDFDGDDIGEVAYTDGIRVSVITSQGKDLLSYRMKASFLGCGDCDGDGVKDLIAYGPKTIDVFFFHGPYGGYMYDLWDDHHPLEKIESVYIFSPAIVVESNGTLYRSVIRFYNPGVLGYVPDITGIVVAIIFVYLLHRYPEWYIVDAVGVIVASGAIAIFGISLGILPTLILLIVMAIYDAISVYRTKHMIDLADTVMDLKLPILLVAPKESSYSFRKQTGLKKQLRHRKERGAMFMGLGDVIIPSVLAMSAMHFLPSRPVYSFGPFILGANTLTGIFTVAGIMVGYAILMRFVLKGNPQAGLPLLNSGAILGYIIGYILIYGDLTLGIV